MAASCYLNVPMGSFLHPERDFHCMHARYGLGQSISYMCRSSLSVGHENDTNAASSLPCLCCRPHVNFISGSNGSGKSAALQAMQCCLGVKARATGRATRAEQFIKTGCSHAVASVTLWNTGHDAFTPDVYGSSITIERRITKSSSTFIIKDASNRKVNGICDTAYNTKCALKELCHVLALQTGVFLEHGKVLSLCSVMLNDYIKPAAESYSANHRQCILQTCISKWLLNRHRLFLHHVMLYRLQKAKAKLMRLLSISTSMQPILQFA